MNRVIFSASLKTEENSCAFFLLFYFTKAVKTHSSQNNVCISSVASLIVHLHSIKRLKMDTSCLSFTHYCELDGILIWTGLGLTAHSAGIIRPSQWGVSDSDEGYTDMTPGFLRILGTGVQSTKEINLISTFHTHWSKDKDPL